MLDKVAFFVVVTSYVKRFEHLWIHYDYYNVKLIEFNNQVIKALKNRQKQTAMYKLNNWSSMVSYVSTLQHSYLDKLLASCAFQELCDTSQRIYTCHIPKEQYARLEVCFSSSNIGSYDMDSTILCGITLQWFLLFQRIIDSNCFIFSNWLKIVIDSYHVIAFTIRVVTITSWTTATHKISVK